MPAQAGIHVLANLLDLRVALALASLPGMTAALFQRIFKTPH